MQWRPSSATADSFSIFASPSLAGSLADERGTRGTEYAGCRVRTLHSDAAFDVWAERFGITVEAGKSQLAPIGAMA